MNVNKVTTIDYEDKCDWTPGENEPNTNPIKANQSQYNAKTNPIRTQSKPMLARHLCGGSKVGYAFWDSAVAIITEFCYALCRYDLAFRKA
ncbi:MAG: hypothetical protein FVQ85_15220 [Planctomycetes bacterium]|nr:hypothetical protein [Planctomycetota bacterium]